MYQMILKFFQNNQRFTRILNRFEKNLNVFKNPALKKIYVFKVFYLNWSIFHERKECKLKNSNLILNLNYYYYCKFRS